MAIQEAENWLIGCVSCLKRLIVMGSEREFSLPKVVRVWAISDETSESATKGL